MIQSTRKELVPRKTFPFLIKLTNSAKGVKNILTVIPSSCPSVRLKMYIWRHSRANWDWQWEESWLAMGGVLNITASNLHRSLFETNINKARLLNFVTIFMMLNNILQDQPQKFLFYWNLIWKKIYK